jgi:predicted membrane metal-binding protein
MYCSNCGARTNSELNFCSRCGTKVSKADLALQKSVSENLSSSLGYIGGFGLFGFIFVALVLVKNGVHPTALTFISLAYLGALFGICYLIVQQIQRYSEKPALKATELQNDFQTERLKATQTAQLEEARQTPIISVTENTTRNFEKIPRTGT